MENTLVSDPFFAFHHVNAFERDGLLFMDIVCYPDAGIIQSFYLDRIFEERQALQVGEFRRYSINLRDSTVSYEVLGNEGLELPRYDESALSLSGQYRYVYGVGVSEQHPQSFYNQLVKLDIESQKSLTWYHDGCYPGEAVFIGKPNKKVSG